MGDVRRASRRRQLAADPELIADTLAQPLANALGALALTRELAPDVGGLRIIMGVEQALRSAVDSLGGYRCAEVRKARRLLRDLKAFINQPGGLARFPHLTCTPRGPKLWVCWERHLDNLARERPQWRKDIEEDRRFLLQQEAEEDADREVGTFFKVEMPGKLVALLEDAKALAPTLGLAQRADLHRRVQRLLIRGAWDSHPAERVLATLLPPALYEMIPAGNA